MVGVIRCGLCLWLLISAVEGELRHGGRSLKGKKKASCNDVAKRLKAEVARLTQEKAALSAEVRSSAVEASNKAKQIAELTAQVSQQQQSIAALRSEAAQKQPSASAGVAELEAKRTQKLAEEGVRQQKEISQLTAQLSAAKIKFQMMQEEFGDPSLRYFLAAKATKVYHDPGIEGAANKTFKYVLPHIAEALKTGTEVYSAMNDTVFESIHSLLGAESTLEPLLPTMSAFLVYGMVCCPFGLMLSYAVEWVCKLKELLLACAFYLFSLSSLAAIFVAATQRDPLQELSEHDSSVFVLQQAGFAAILVFQMFLIALAFCSAANSDEAPAEVWMIRLCQTCFIFFFSFIYYRLVWTPTMVDETPRTDLFGTMLGLSTSPKVLPYALTACGFLVNLGLEWRLQGIVEEETQAEKDEKDA